MNVTNTNNNPVSFNARCVQVRDAQWVCHAINTTFPHFSTSRFKPLFTKKLLETYPNFKNKEPKTLSDLFTILNSIHEKSDIKNIGFFKRLRLKLFKNIFLSKKEKQNIKLLTKVREKILEFGEIRNTCESVTTNSLDAAIILLEKYQMGNCLESAKLAELVLKLNGENNAAVSMIYDKTGKQLDHAVCIFNRDGSKFKGKITNDTIIVDPWADKADFAKNMITYYKNTQKSFFDIYDNSQIYFEPVNSVYLTDFHRKIFKQKYPDLFFKSTNRKFMQNSK